MTRVMAMMSLLFFVFMKITLNNKQTETAATNIDELAKELSLPERGVAIAVNENMVRRDEWTATALAENDNVLVIKAACGG